LTSLKNTLSATLITESNKKNGVIIILCIYGLRSAAAPRIFIGGLQPSGLGRKSSSGSTGEGKGKLEQFADIVYRF